MFHPNNTNIPHRGLVSMRAVRARALTDFEKLLSKNAIKSKILDFRGTFWVAGPHWLFKLTRPLHERDRNENVFICLFKTHLLIRDELSRTKFSVLEILGIPGKFLDIVDRLFKCQVHLSLETDDFETEDFWNWRDFETNRNRKTWNRNFTSPNFENSG